MHHELIPLPLTPHLSWVKSSQSFWGNGWGSVLLLALSSTQVSESLLCKIRAVPGRERVTLSSTLLRAGKAAAPTAVKDQPAVTSTICELSTSRSCCLGCGTKLQILDWPRKARNALRKGPGCSQVGLASRNPEPQNLPRGQNIQGNPGPGSNVTAGPVPTKISGQTTLSGITEEVILSLWI